MFIPISWASIRCSAIKHAGNIIINKTAQFGELYYFLLSNIEFNRQSFCIDLSSQNSSSFSSTLKLIWKPESLGEAKQDSGYLNNTKWRRLQQSYL